MAARPTLFYPTAPKPEWFMAHASNMSSVSVNNVDYVNTTNQPKDVLGAVPSWFLKMRSSQYKEYLEAHKMFLANVQFVDEKLHNDGLRRRALESLRQVPGRFFTEIDDEEPRSSEVPPPQLVTIPSNDPGEVTWVEFVSEKKTPHVPQVSTKPHRAEKRDLKKKLRDAKVAKTNEALKARTELAAEVKAPEIKTALAKVQEVKDLAPLHKAELTAAKSAAARAKQIRFGSSDFTTNVEVDGWKVVTRKKGDYWPQFARVDEQLASPGAAGHTAVRMDPSIGSLGSLALSTLRKPTQVGSAK